MPQVRIEKVARELLDPGFFGIIQRNFQTTCDTFKLPPRVRHDHVIVGNNEWPIGDLT